MSKQASKLKPKPKPKPSRGGSRKGAGRKPEGNRVASEAVFMRCEPDDRKLLQAVAELHGVSLARYIRETALAAAREAIQGQQGASRKSIAALAASEASDPDAAYNATVGIVGP